MSKKGLLAFLFIVQLVCGETKLEPISKCCQRNEILDLDSMKCIERHNIETSVLPEKMVNLTDFRLFKTTLTEADLAIR
jgi:hypothetical protein